MRYHYKENNSQKLTGLVVVIVLHVVLTYVLINNLSVIDRKIEYGTIKAEVIDIPPPKVEIVIPIAPSEIKRSLPILTPAPTFDFEEATAGVTNAITQIQQVNESVVSDPIIFTAKRSSKGLTHPKYPEESARLGEQGVTELNLNIAESGDVVEALVISTSGFERLDKAIVLHALSHWKLTPCTSGEKAVSCWHPFTFKWDIANAKKAGTWRAVVSAK